MFMRAVGFFMVMLVMIVPVLFVVVRFLMFVGFMRMFVPIVSFVAADYRGQWDAGKNNGN